MTKPSIAIIVEGGLVRGVYLDGRFVDDAAVYDFDLLDGGDPDEVEALKDDVRALDPDTDLGSDAATYIEED